jgi:hypothetical protein
MQGNATLCTTNQRKEKHGMKHIHNKRRKNDEIFITIASVLLASIAISATLITKVSGAEEIPWRNPETVTNCHALKMPAADETAQGIGRVKEPAPETTEAAPVKAKQLTLTYYEEIPLDADVQDLIFTMCEQREIDPAIVFAIIWRESRYDASVIGDNGNAVGLMQIQERYHTDRMARLGCDDLLNPLQNVTVGIDYLAEMIGREKGVKWAVTAYNRGAVGANRCGGFSEYAREVLAEAERMNADVLYR